MARGFPYNDDAAESLEMKREVGRECSFFESRLEQLGYGLRCRDTATGSADG